MKVGSVLMLGARMNYAVPRILYEAGLLGALYTDSYVGNKPLLKSSLRMISKISNPKFIKQWLGRECREIDPNLIRSFEILGIRYALERRRSRTLAELELLYLNTAQRFCSLITNKSLEDSSFIWGYNAGSSYLFERLKGTGIKLLLEQTILPKCLEISYIKRVLGDFSEQKLLKSPLDLDYSPIIEIENSEWQCSDSIFAGSNFVRDGLVSCGVPASKISVIQYGVQLPPLVESRLAASYKSHRDRKLRLLFVGEVGVRKGVPYLLEALSMIPKGKVECRFLGNNTFSESYTNRFSDVASFLGIVPREEVAEHYAWADVFVLPSVVEGSATASYEAISHCLPSIVTPNVGSRVVDGLNGFIIKPFDVNSIVSAISVYYDNPDVLSMHRRSSGQLRNSISYENYRDELLLSLSSLC